MLDLEIPIKKMPIKRTMEIIRKASGKPKNTIKAFYKNLDTHAGRKVSNNPNTGNLNRNDVKRLIKDSRKQGLFLSEEKLKQEFSEIGEEEKQRMIKYGKLRNKMSERLEKIKAGHFESSSEYKRVKEGRKNKRELRLEKVHDIMITAAGHNKVTKTFDSHGGWTNIEDEQKNNSDDNSDNSKKSENDTPQDKQPLDLPID